TMKLPGCVSASAIVSGCGRLAKASAMPRISLSSSAISEPADRAMPTMASDRRAPSLADQPTSDRVCPMSGPGGPRSGKSSATSGHLAFVEARHQLGEVAGSEADVELLAQDVVPAVLAGAGRARQREDV